MSNTVILNNELRNGHETAQELGLTGAEATSELTDFVCPEHGERILHEVAQTVHGTFEAHTCASGEGCAYDRSSPMKHLS